MRLNAVTTFICFIGTFMMEAQNNIKNTEGLITVAETGAHQPIGVSVSGDNRLFVSFPNKEPYKYGLAEITSGRQIAYPDMKWNSTEGNETEHFVNVQDIYVDTDDYLWVLDSKPASKNSVFGEDKKEDKEGKFKLLQIELKTNRVKKAYLFEDLDRSKSALNDVRVDTEKALAYLSDPGQSAIVILDLKTGKTRIVLQNDPSTVAEKDFVLSYEGKEMRDKNGNPFQSNVNGIALTKDNKYFYYRPINTLYLYRIETRYLADHNLSAEKLSGYVENMGKTSVCHGMVADKKGNIYLTSSMDYSIKYLTPEGELHTLIQDEELIWPDSLGIGTDGYLYFSCAQVNRLPQWNEGKDRASLPYKIFKIKLP
ncbi:SMP-30/gluconolactonase/LRE family protein [Paenimyroides ceti]